MKLKTAVSAIALAILSYQAAAAQTVRIAEHRQARIDALKEVVPEIEKQSGMKIEVVEYPGPDKEYLSKLLTELRAGTGPDIFSLPSSGEIVDFASAGYLADVTDTVKSSEAWNNFFPVAQKMAVNRDGKIYVMPTMLAAQEFYYRRDLLEKAGISTAQPKNWDDLLQRAIDAKQKTGEYSLLMPLGVTWGGGTYIESFRLLMASSSAPQLVTADGKFDLNGKGVQEVLTFYKKLIDNKLLPVEPLLGPDPWVIPKYQMFPDGKLMITTCGSWCYIFDWGPKSKKPIADIEKNVGTWSVPGINGGEQVLVGLNHPWTVSNNATSPAAAKKVLAAMGSVNLMVSYAKSSGNLPSRRDAADSPGFKQITPLVGLMSHLDKGVYADSAPGFSTVMEGIGRATESLLLGKSDVAGAQKILVDYVKNTLGDDVVK